MPTYLDKTLKDTIRRALNVREQQVDSLLPAVVLQEYPKFVTFLKKYFELQEQDGSLNRFLNNVFETRDVQQGWDGRDTNGKMSTSGVYIYQIRLVQPDGSMTEDTGTVMLIL